MPGRSFYRVWLSNDWIVDSTASTLGCLGDEFVTGLGGVPSIMKFDWLDSKGAILGGFVEFVVARLVLDTCEVPVL